DLCASRVPVKRSLFDKFCKRSHNRNTEREEEIWLLLSESLNALSCFKISLQTHLETLRDRLTALREAPSTMNVFGEFVVHQLQKEHAVTNSVLQLLSKSRSATCDHALDSLQLCLKSLSAIKAYKV